MTKWMLMLALVALNSQAFAGFGQAPNKDMLWPNGVVPYTVDDKCPVASGTIRVALNEFTRRTGGVIRFVELQDHHLDGVRFTSLENDRERTTESVQGAIHGWEYGRYPGVRPIMLAPTASVATIQHEIMHKLGFLHEQQRPDRDRFLLLDLDGLSKRLARQFEMIESERVAESLAEATRKKSYVLYTPYDVDSLMQYSSRSLQNQVLTRSGYAIPEAQGLSDGDVKSIRAMYQDSKTPHGSYYTHISGKLLLEWEKEPEPKLLFNFGGSPRELRYIVDEKGLRHRLVVNRLTVAEEEKELVRIELWTNCGTGSEGEELHVRPDYFRLHLKDGTKKDFRLVRRGIDENQGEEIVRVE